MAPQRTPTFPNGSDYVDALQNPQTAFTDPDLQAATVKQDQFGFPSPRSGNFASVFKMFQRGRNHCAVRTRFPTARMETTAARELPRTRHGSGTARGRAPSGGGPPDFHR